ncbi:serine hydrolase, partial [uncultured Bifidobacterium sp.]|uniref:serine hydrolase n=1 Tax=uncultured Bifidobacterium sp. TaxID=165187 RepID=UPI0028DB406E
MPVISDYSDGVGSVSFTLRDSSGRVLASRGGDVVYYAASTIKLAVAMAVIEEVEAGGLAWDRMVPCTHSFTSARGGVFSLAEDPDEMDAELPPDGTPISVRDLLEAMIDRSSNEATNMLLGLMGIPRVQRLCREQGMRLLHIERQIGDLAARDSGQPNEVTSDELSLLMLRGAGRGWNVDRGDLAFLRGALSRQRFAVIADVLPAGVPRGSKSGSVTGIEHDVAFIG